MKKAIFFVLVALFLASLKADDACTFLPGKSYLPSQVTECLNLIPLDPKVKSFTLERVKFAFQIYPLTDVLPKIGADIPKLIEEIENKNYANEFDFHYDIFKLLQHTPDSATAYYQPAGYYNLQIARPLVFVPVKNTNNFKVHSINPGYSLPVPADLIGKKVKSVNEISVADYISDGLYYFTSKSMQFSRNYFSQAETHFLHDFVFPKYDQDTFLLANGTKVTLPVHIFVAQGSAIANLTDLIKQNSYSDEETAEKRRSERSNSEDMRKLGSSSSAPQSPLPQTKNSKRHNTLSDYEVSRFVNGVERGIAHTHDSVIPFLRINALSRIDTNLPKVVLNFVTTLAQRKAKLAIIDLTQFSGSGNLCTTEWVINVLSQTLSEPYQADTYNRRAYRTLLDSRITSKYGKQLFQNLFFPLTIDPTTDLPFSDQFCLVNHPTTRTRYNSKERFTNKFYLSSCKVFTQDVPRFKTKFLILTSSKCGGTCGHFQNVLRKTGVAKIIALGGLSKKRFNLNFSYYGAAGFYVNSQAVPLLSYAPIFQTPPPTNGDIVFSMVQPYLTDLDIPEAVIPLYADRVIGWNKFTLPPVLIPPPLDLYAIASSEYSISVKKTELPVFKPEGKCYAKPVRQGDGYSK